jgi:hypothetical protein
MAIGMVSLWKRLGLRSRFRLYTFSVNFQIISKKRIFINRNCMPNEIKFFTHGSVKCCLVLFTNHTLADDLFSYYNKYGKFDKAISMRYTNEPIKFSKSYLLTDCKKFKWFAVVVRNIPRTYSHEKLVQMLYVNENRFLYCLPPTDVGNSRCSIAVFKDRDAAEKLCVNLNNTKLENYYELKVCLD